MALRFFKIPVCGDPSAEELLNQLLSMHRIIHVDKRFVEDGATSFWTICVEFLHSKPADMSAGDRRLLSTKSRVDYRTVLPPEDFAVFAKLRDLRKELAAAEAVPVYTIFTNEQLAQMVMQRASSRADLSKVDGVGDARIDKYGESVLSVLVKAWSHDEASGKVDGADR
jgi:superfamily II DNA helicase RecQ